MPASVKATTGSGAGTGLSLAVLWQNEHFPDVARGGGGAVNTRYICRAMAQRGHRPVVIARGHDTASLAEEIVDGVSVIRLAPPSSPPGLWPLWPLLLPYALRTPLAALAARFDVFCAVDAPYALALKRAAPRRPLLYRVEGLPSERPKSATALGPTRRAARRLLELSDYLVERLAWRRADLVIVKSRFMADALTRGYGVPASRIAIVPNGVDFSRFATARSRKDAPSRVQPRDSSRVVVAFVGRLVAMKNVGALLEAVALMRYRTRVALLIVGDGEQRGVLEAQAQRLGLAACCVFTGLTEHVEQVLGVTDIFVLPSTFEPFGNALIEAMAAGAAPVAFRPDGRVIRTASAEILRHGDTGLLVDPPTPDALARTLDQLVENVELRLRLGCAAQREVELRYSWERCAARYLELALEAARS